MKRLPLFITLGVIIFLIGGYFLYDRYLAQKSVNPWSLVPQTTIFVYEPNDCAECVQQLKQTSLWTILRQAAFYQKQTDSLRLLFDFLETQNKGQLMSAHLTRKDDFDFIFYVPLTAANKNTLLTAWAKMPSTQREFNSIAIHELKGNKFSWTLIDNIWVGSFTPFLLEDVIRTHTQGSSFKDEIASVYQLPHIKKDAGNLYIHIKNLGAWFSTFSPETPDIIKRLGQASLLDVKADKNNFVLNGFSIDSARQGYLLSLFNDQIPVSFNLKNKISNRAILFSNYGISEGTKLGQALAAYQLQYNKKLADSLALIRKTIGVEPGELYANLGHEVGVCYLEGKNQTLTRILLIDTKDTKPWKKAFHTLAEKTSMDTIFFERFSEYEIREIPVHNFPEKMLWPFVTGFPTSYYTTVDNLMIISEDLEELKKFLDDIDKEETWGKSIAQNKFLETTLLESNISLYINTPYLWNILADNMHPKWQTFLKDYKRELSALGMGAIQMSHLNNSYYTNITFQLGEMSGTTRTQETKASTTDSKLITTFPKGIYKFAVVRNHSTKQDDVLVQDSTYAVSLIEANGKTVWKVQLDQFIQGDINQIDYYNNGKLQLFFATPGTLHVIDRLGNYVQPYPLKIKEQHIKFVSVIDYDHSKKYRFLIASTTGKLWMYDKEGNNLDGWKPNNTEGNIFTAPQHHRIRGKDYVVAIREDGVACAFNRRGEKIKNFPLNLQARPVGNYFLENGSSIATSNFVIISRDGERIKFNMEGAIQSRETLIKATPDAYFSLAAEADLKSYVVVRQEKQALTLISDALQDLASSDFIGKNPASIQVYEFGGGKRFITITDRSQDLSFVYDMQGNLLNSLPLEGNRIILRSAGNKVIYYTTQGNTLIIAPL